MRACLLASVLVVVPLATLGDASHSRRGEARTTRRWIAPGAHYTKIVRPKKHLVIHQISVRLGARSTLDVALAGGALGRTEALSSLAGRHGAVAAVNGDFGTLYNRPWHTYAQDGELVQTERLWGRSLVIGSDETRPFIGHPRVSARVWVAGTGYLPIDRVNEGKPDGDAVTLFTPEGKPVEDPPDKACSARFRPVGAPQVDEYGALVQTTRVERARCSSSPLWLRDNGWVISSRQKGRHAAAIGSLVEGSKARFTWRTNVDATDDVIGGNPLIVMGGKVLPGIVYDCGYLCALHPRTAAGITKDGVLILVVVDGRSERARGMRLYELARYFVRRNVERAILFDGGGASEMWINGRVVNTPSDGRERPLVNALLLFRGDDGGAPAPFVPFSTSTLRAGATEPGPDPFARAASDPGSTGGLADFLDRRGARVPTWTERVARELRAARGGR